MHKELFSIARHYGDSCSNCEEACCINMALVIIRDDVRKIAKSMRLKPEVFRKKYTALLKNYLNSKGMEIKCSPEGQRQMDNNPRILVFEDHKLIENIVSREQRNRLREMKMEEITVCPFFDTETRKCIIHKMRPQACYEYPFELSYNGDIDIRKVNACVLSTNFLKRLNAFMKKNELPSVDNILEEKEYHNHFYIPGPIAFLYIAYECEKLNIPVTSKEIQETKGESENGICEKDGH